VHASLVALALLAATNPSVRSQSLDVRFVPAEHRANVTASYEVAGEGELRFRLNARADVSAVVAGGEEQPFRREDDELAVDLDGDEEQPIVRFEAVYEEDLAKGERSGQIHNLSVDAHVGEEGIFLGEGSAWHPQWLDESATPELVQSSVRIDELDGWAVVASGNPRVDPAQLDLKKPVWAWQTPRPVAGVAVAGNRHELQGRLHETAHGPVQLVMHVPPEHRELAPLFLDAAGEYLDLYVPLLCAFPYARFSIVENFFSSGFAFAGFTLLGPRVVGMAPRSLAPGYLDHELVHNWWGNGVYADPEDGDWCEALTTYSANYYRRIADDGEEAGLLYRRGILMMLSSQAAELDDGAVGDWGAAGRAGINRFVGYEKGAFVLAMLERDAGLAGRTPEQARLWPALRRFAAEHMGKRAGWDDLRRAIEAQLGESREAFFQKWVREHSRPNTPTDLSGDAAREFYRVNRIEGLYDVATGEDEDGPWKEIDPNFRAYRVLPPGQIIPTITATFGHGRLTVKTRSSRAEVASFRAHLQEQEGGDNFLLIGHAAIRENEELIARTANPIVVGRDFFEIEGRVFDKPTQAVLHNMPHPDKPGHVITVFHSNGDPGWSRLRLIRFYTRDTTIVWEDDAAITRGVFEPSRKIHAGEKIIW
jgi:hypothetical protein